ncbi:MAG: P-loop containing nucleoside triphosphate hydrolase protein, partial [Olpidium bornovanus]
PDGGLTVVDDKNGVATVKGQVVAVANSEEEALYYLFEGEANRSIADHLMNKNSTRSHCVFTIHVESRSRVESSEKVTYSKLNLVDLAGSERLSKTNSSGVTLKEAMCHHRPGGQATVSGPRLPEAGRARPGVARGGLIQFPPPHTRARAPDGSDHVPYRQSKLSNVLRDALGGNCNTLM